ncbi:baculoviral IAP repeat-containing protein 7-B-like [Ornithodoros turicata]|uniref:baculoviral IAP repeat-containing protein 7-B-like n=1 Tax=Ornithodoros turicata TaxID=34597 RepID=UPI003139F1F0
MAIGNISYVPPSRIKRPKSIDDTDGGTESAEQEPRTEDAHCDLSKVPTEEFGIVTRPDPVFPEYTSLRSRIKSFGSYPHHCKNSPLEMAKAGLFYNGFGENDRVVCFQCSGALYLWDDDDVPLEEHARWYPSCPFVRLALGQTGVQSVNEAHQEALEKASQLDESDKDLEVLTDYYSNREGARFFESFGITKATLYNAMKGMQERGEDITDQDLVEAALGNLITFQKHPIVQTVPASEEVSVCAVCRQEERGIIFFPCGHVATCVNCAAATTTCPICRGLIAASMKAFLS